MGPLRKLNRLPVDTYQGARAYSLTFCTSNRNAFFLDERVVQKCLDDLRKTSIQSFDIYIYCFMPDHLHLLAVAKHELANLISFVKDFKQRTGFWFKKTRNQPLWQKSYFDHILRKDEDVETVARYIMSNPLRAGLVADPLSYPFTGSFVFNIRDLV